MSSYCGEKKKQSRSEGVAAASSAPPSKRQKTETHHSLLLETQPEILRKIYSFLSLKEAIVLRQVHRQFNESSNDLYQYSFIVNDDTFRNRGFDRADYWKYLKNQTEGLCNLVDNENLHAVLRNETLDDCLAENFLSNLIRYSKTDNGQAVTILLQDERCIADVDDLERSLRKGFNSMAAVLQQDVQQDEEVKNDIQICPTCENNIGCFFCVSRDYCIMGEEPRYCRACVLEDNRFCQSCGDYLCPECDGVGLFDACDKCGEIECQDDKECLKGFLYRCETCIRKKCKSCAEEDGEMWVVGSEPCACPACQDDISSS